MDWEISRRGESPRCVRRDLTDGAVCHIIETVDPHFLEV